MEFYEKPMEPAPTCTTAADKQVIVRNVTRRICRRFRHISREDIEQEAWVAILEAEKKCVDAPYLFNAAYYATKRFATRTNVVVSGSEDSLRQNYIRVSAYTTTENGWLSDGKRDPLIYMVQKAAGTIPMRLTDEARHALRKVLGDKLGNTEKAVIASLVLLDGESPKDVADTLGYPRQTVYRAVHEGRVTLKRKHKHIGRVTGRLLWSM
jgi:DNA-directed RNA polymerase specialized sigma24 family protein